ncbi:hypothetical protein TTHERM_00492610 (macronuclear) [Tetrahymena thermophila SB210]|uniref:Uncharacterized protein n=1 Tax=Tetrahymena thermophila (strain SB210) TaxID=312017 RepID=I7MHE6_TETTS|nr:hypothetical protein TTHERM_00492610 [Tetrahymena thermophila SB210]EAS02908.2 hypothetical protein TTHERM_00492610 [Tetrahymena thermophila SB210]|eukprot:XP_001023153.2 hypothetical protein TTHERM_00492610 [Tetrahymena thermophila SB210]
MFINYVSQDQIKQILSKNLLPKGMNTTNQQPKKKKNKKKNNSEIRKCSDQKDEQKGQDNSNNQHIKSQDVSLKKYKPDEQEDKIIRAYSQSPQPKENEQNTNEEAKKIQENISFSKNNENIANEEKKQTKRSSEQHINKKLNTNLSDTEKESHIQALNMLQSSPYSDKKQKNMVKNTLFPILEAKQFERQNKHRKLMPLKESVNQQNNNGSTYFQQLSNSFRQSIDINGSNPSSVNSNYKFINQHLQRPRSSSQKVSPSRQLQSGPVNPNKINYNTLQDNISFYTQNSYRNGVQINSFRSSSQNMQSEEKSLNTDYSQIIKNRKMLDQTLYSTQYKPYKNSYIVLNQSIQYQDNLDRYKNQDANQNNNQINFYDDQHQRPNKYKIKIIRSSSSKKQNDTKISSIEKIYKRKVSCILEQFSPNKKKQLNSPKSKQKKKIQQLAAKDICITQSQNSNINGDQSLQTIAEASQTQNK